MTPRLTYTRDSLIQLRLQLQPGLRLFCSASTDYFPKEILRGHGNRKTHNNKVTRRGLKKSGVRARLKRETHKQRALKSIILANVRSLRSKLDELQACVNHLHEYRTASVLAFMESWLNNSDYDSALHIDGFSPPLRLDRDRKRTGKQHGGGVCLYVNNSWCSTVTVREKLWTTDIKLLAVSLRPTTSPENSHSFSSSWFTSTPELMQLKPQSTSPTLCTNWNNYHRTLPSSSCVISTTVPLTSRLKDTNSMLHAAHVRRRLWINAMALYQMHLKPYPSPLSAQQTTNTILLAPAYTPVIKRIKKVTKNIKQWTAEGILTLQGCVKATDWDSLLSPSDDIDEQVNTVTSYISFCVDNIMPSKTVSIYPNNKPWITKELKGILNKKKRIFFTGSALDKKEVNRKVKRAIKTAKLEHKVERNSPQGTSTQPGSTSKPWPL
ncbi:unnamed protein product [Oreochromis niloticus]|nr:unnamed protein product [Mustela putorius furo]